MNPYLAHMIGDYILQNDYISFGKKKSSWICLLHILLYLLPFCFCQLSMGQLVLIGVQHFVQDRWNFVVWFMKVKGCDEFLKPPCAPWSVIVTDNTFHLMWIALVVAMGS